MSTSPRIAFFGTPDLTIPVLDALEAANLTPQSIVTAPDRPVGRKQVLTPPASKIWAAERHIPVLQPSHRDQIYQAVASDEWDLFIVFAYGQILSPEVINLPRLNTLNLHPSLLPSLRGPSPIRSAILQDQRHTGVSIITLDEQMDHGPIVAQQAVSWPETTWPPYGPDLDQHLVALGADLLTNTIPAWLDGDIHPAPQDDARATYCHKLTRADGELSLDPYNLPTGKAAYDTLLRIRGLAGWPGCFFIHNDCRIKICTASIKNDQLVIHRIIPAGKTDMSFTDYFAVRN